MIQIKIDTVVVLQNRLDKPVTTLQKELNKVLKNTGTSLTVINVDGLKLHLHITTIVTRKMDIEDESILKYWIVANPCQSLKVYQVKSCSYVRIKPPTSGLIAKYIELLTPELEKQIVFNRLVFTGSQKFNNGKKSFYLAFAAYNNELDQWQNVSYEPATGYLHVTLHHLFFKPQK